LNPKLLAEEQKEAAVEEYKNYTIFFDALEVIMTMQRAATLTLPQVLEGVQGMTMRCVSFCFATVLLLLTSTAGALVHLHSLKS
jgi:hypothetical protein